MNHIAITVTIRNAVPLPHPCPQPLSSPARALKVSANIVPRNITASEVPALEFAWQLGSPRVEGQSSSPPVTPLDFPVSPLD